MAGPTTATALAAFAAEKDFRGKGPLCVALVVTQHAKNLGLPLEPQKLVTAGGGQVLRLGKTAVQSVLGRHGIRQVPAAEGGRTSRGSLRRMREYVTFLNTFGTEVDLDAVESFWVDRVKDFFSAQPLRIKLDASKGIQAVVLDLIDEAKKREMESGGVWYAGAVLQHLVGAALDCTPGIGEVPHNSFSTADAPSGRRGDFFLGDVAIHVTTSPGEAVIDRCRDNLDDGHRPVVITRARAVRVAQELASARRIEERLDVFGIEQFVSARVYEQGRYTAEGRRTAFADLVDRYNTIIDSCETDPSLKIQIR